MLLVVDLHKDFVDVECVAVTTTFAEVDFLSLSNPVSSVSSIVCSSIFVARVIISDNRCVKA